MTPDMPSSSPEPAFSRCGTGGGSGGGPVVSAGNGSWSGIGASAAMPGEVGILRFVELLNDGIKKVWSPCRKIVSCCDCLSYFMGEMANGQSFVSIVF